MGKHKGIFEENTFKKDIESLIFKEANISVFDNDMTLASMLEETDDKSSYEHFVDVVSVITKELYKNFRFLRQDPAPEDYQSGNCLIFQVNRGELPVVYEYLFRYAVKHQLKEGEISKVFTERVRQGKVVPLGDVQVQEIGTGVSSILQAQDFRILITFKTEEYIEKGKEQKEKAEKEKAEKEQTEKDIVEARRVAVQTVNHSTQVLSDISDMLNDADSKTMKEAIGYVQDLIIKNYNKTF